MNITDIFYPLEGYCVENAETHERFHAKSLNEGITLAKSLCGIGQGGVAFAGDMVLVGHGPYTEFIIRRAYRTDFPITETEIG